MDETITYEPILKKDAEEITRLYEKYLNRGRYIHKHVLEGMRDADYIGYRATAGGRTAGFVSGRAGIDFTCPHPLLEGMLKERFSDHTIYTPDALVVTEEYRHRRIASGLFQRLLFDLRGKGCRLLLTELWIYPDGCIPAEPVVSKWGTTVFERSVRGFYTNAAEYGIECPICGKNCVCGAKIKVLDIGNGGESNYG